jgi:4-hydroxy-tetrahydrodipicolinate reductase
MGHEIENVATERGHSISYRITSASKENVADVKNADVAIEFTRPDTAFSNNKILISNGIPVICGTTGWNQHLSELSSYVEQVDGVLLYRSNFSIGVNIFFEVNRKLAEIMNQFAEYDVSMEEIHHIKKIDAPSGTAVTLAEQIIEKLKRKNQWELAGEAAPDKKSIIITSKREGNVPGTHKLKYSSPIDDIVLLHKAHNRVGFALGALLAAEWIQDKKGFLTMSDFLNF